MPPAHVQRGRRDLFRHYWLNVPTTTLPSIETPAARESNPPRVPRFTMPLASVQRKARYFSALLFDYPTTTLPSAETPSASDHDPPTVPRSTMPPRLRPAEGVIISALLVDFPTTTLPSAETP